MSIKKVILSLLVLCMPVVVTQVSAIGLPFFSKVNIPNKYVAVAAGIGAAYYGLKNYFDLNTIEKRFKNPVHGVSDLTTGDFINWRIDATVGNHFSTAQSIIEKTEDAQKLLISSIKDSKTSHDALKVKMKEQKKELRDALFYLYGRSEIPQQFFTYCKTQEFKEDFNKLSSIDKDKHDLDILCGFFNKSLQECPDWDFLIDTFKKNLAIKKPFYKKNEELTDSAIGETSSKQLKMGLVKSQASNIYTFFNRTVLYMPNLRVWQWKVFPFASKTDEIFFKLLKKYTRLCALSVIFDEALIQISSEKEQQNEKRVTKKVAVTVSTPSSKLAKKQKDSDEEGDDEQSEEEGTSLSPVQRQKVLAKEAAEKVSNLRKTTTPSSTSKKEKTAAGVGSLPPRLRATPIESRPTYSDINPVDNVASIGKGSLRKRKNG